MAVHSTLPLSPGPLLNFIKNKVRERESEKRNEHSMNEENRNRANRRHEQAASVWWKICDSLCHRPFLFGFLSFLFFRVFPVLSFIAIVEMLHLWRKNRNGENEKKNRKEIMKEYNNVVTRVHRTLKYVLFVFWREKRNALLCHSLKWQKSFSWLTALRIASSILKSFCHALAFLYQFYNENSRD